MSKGGSEGADVPRAPRKGPSTLAMDKMSFKTSLAEFKIGASKYWMAASVPYLSEFPAEMPDQYISCCCNSVNPPFSPLSPVCPPLPEDYVGKVRAAHICK